jgi:hypothetical protein
MTAPLRSPSTWPAPPATPEATRVEIEHRGWERLSPQTARPWRDRNRASWQTLLPHFIEAITQGED